MSSDMIYTIILGMICAIIMFFLFGRKIIYHGPNSKDVKNKIFRINNKCFALEPVIHVCPGGVAL